MLVLASSYPFLGILGTMIIFFAWVIFIWIAITVLIDVFRRHDIGGGTKALWVIFVIILPFLGVFVYLIAEHNGMTERAISQQQEAKSQMDQYVRSVAAQGDPAEQIAKAKALLDQGTITQAEFDQIKSKALAAA